MFSCASCTSRPPGFSTLCSYFLLFLALHVLSSFSGASWFALVFKALCTYFLAVYALFLHSIDIFFFSMLRAYEGPPVFSTLHACLLGLCTHQISPCFLGTTHIFFFSMLCHVFLGSTCMFTHAFYSVRIMLRLCFLHSMCIFDLFHAPCAFSCALNASTPACVFYAPHMYFFFSMLYMCFLMLRMHNSLFISSMLHSCFLALCAHTVRPCFLCSMHSFFFSTFCTCFLALLAHHVHHVFSYAPRISRFISVLVLYVYFHLFFSQHVFSCAPCPLQSIHVFYTPCIFSSFVSSIHVFLCSACIAVRLYFLCSVHILLLSARIMICQYFLLSAHIFFYSMIHACFLTLCTHNNLPLFTVLHPNFLLFHALCLFSYAPRSS